MARRRQGLAQRRKAVGLTQESLAQRLGVERSTVVRWEAGDTEPLPSIRPNLARALQVSIDQLTELLTEPGADTPNTDTPNTGTTPALPADAEVAIPVLLPEVPPIRAEFEDLIRPQVIETVEALHRALRSAGVSPEDLEAMLLVGRSARVGTDVRPYPPVPPPIRARSRWFTRLAAAGVLALAFAGGAASVPFITSHSRPIPPAAATPAPSNPVAAIPAPDPGARIDNSTPSTETGHTTPAAAPNEPAKRTAPPRAAAVPVLAATWIENWTTSRSTLPAAKTTPPRPRKPAISAETFARSRTAALSAADQRRTHFRPQPPRRP